MLEVLSKTGWLTVFLGLLLVGIFLWRLTSAKMNLPPGPTGLPIFGYLPFLTRTPHLKLQRLAEKYGDVMSFNVLGLNFVHLNSADAIREAFVSNDFVGRPELLPLGLPLLANLGIIPSEGEPWKIHRRFALHTLRDFGFGKQSLEDRVRDITEDILRELETSNGKPMDVKDLLAASTANVICSMVFDRHFKLDDPLFVKFKRSMDEILGSVTPIQPFLNGPLVRYLPLRHTQAVKSIIKANRGFDEVVDALIKDHQDTFDPTFLRDYVDVFLAEMKKNAKSPSAEGSTFTIERLKAVTFDLFVAGTETTSNTIHWALAYLMFRPEIQDKLQTEIDTVIGTDRLPAMADRTKMAYTEAVISEVMRISSLITTGAMHSNAENATFRGYHIPKKSQVIANLWSVHRDPKCWPDPEKFDPTRFLNSERKYEKRDNLIPFSIGKRVCLGESLARMELFIMFTSIFQKFHIYPEDGATQDSLKVELGIVRTLLPYKLCVQKRVC